MPGLTQEDKETIAQALKNGQTLGQAEGLNKPGGKSIPEETCIELRQEAVTGKTSYDLRDEYQYNASNIRCHLRGDCEHDGPDLEYTGTGGTHDGEWVEQ